MDSSKPKNGDEQSPRSWRGQRRFLLLRSLGTVSAAGQDWRVWNQAMKQRLLTIQAPADEQEVGNPTAMGRICCTRLLHGDELHRQDWGQTGASTQIPFES